MPRRNLLAIFLCLVVSLACYAKTEHDPYASDWRYATSTIRNRALFQTERRAMFQGAMEGVVGVLQEQGDDYAAFYPPQESRRTEDELKQKLTGGIGIQYYVDKEKKRPVVVRAIVGTPRPAFDAGIRAGDQIMAVEGKDTEGLDTLDIKELIIGEIDRPVRLTVRHEGETENVDVQIERATIETNSVIGFDRDAKGRWRYLLPTTPRIAYLRIETFGSRTSLEIEQILTSLRERGKLNGLILDLRDNLGGVLTGATETCNLFIGQSDEIVSTRDRQGQVDRAFLASGDGTFQNIPIVVLTNGASASASEIVAACLQDHDRAIVVGSRTFGKGSVQDLVRLPRSRSTLKLTVATYWRPSGKNIHRTKQNEKTDDWGVMPNDDCTVKLDDDQQLARIRQQRSRDGYHPEKEHKPASLDDVDPQLKKGIEVMLNELEQPAAEKSPSEKSS